MVTKKQMIDVLSSIGIEGKGMTKDELTNLCELHGFIQDGLLIKEKPEAPKPEAPEPEAPEPEAPEPEAPEPEAPEPEAPGPEAPGPEAPEPEKGEPEKGEPEKVKLDELKDLFKKIEQAEGKTETTGGAKPPLFSTERKKRKRGESSPDNFRIEGYILLMVIDTVFPFSLSWLNNMFDKRVKIPATRLMLTEKQFKELEPLADQAADYLAIHVNPVVGFLLVSSFLYSNNLIQARIEIASTLPPPTMKIKR
jgi:hypothetical protein